MIACGVILLALMIGGFIGFYKMLKSMKTGFQKVDDEFKDKDLMQKGRSSIMNSSMGDFVSTTQ